VFVSSSRYVSIHCLQSNIKVIKFDFLFIKSDGRDIFDNDQTRQQQLPPSYQQGKNGKISISEHREQYYQTVRKQSAQSPGLDSALERIPEYSEGQSVFLTK
jgi:hypothetical protein